MIKPFNTRGIDTRTSTQATRRKAQWRNRALGAAVTSALAFSGPALAQTISYITAGSNYTQDFNSMPASGSFTLGSAGPIDMTASPISASGMTGWQLSKNFFGLLPKHTHNLVELAR